MSKLSSVQIIELDSKLTAFDRYVANKIEETRENDKEQIEKGEYSYLVEEHCIMKEDVIHFSEEVENDLVNSTLSKKEFIERAINSNQIEFKYCTLSNPHQYGGPIENEFYTIPWDGDRQQNIARNNVLEFAPSFSIKDLFETSSEFIEEINHQISRFNYIESYYLLFVNKNEDISVYYNTDYDLVRVKLKAVGSEIDPEILDSIRTELATHFNENDNNPLRDNLGSFEELSSWYDITNGYEENYFNKKFERYLNILYPEFKAKLD